MADEKRRLDESLSIEAFRKSLSGDTDVRPALDRLTVSQSGQIQPASPPPSATATSPQSPAAPHVPARR